MYYIELLATTALCL